GILPVAVSDGYGGFQNTDPKTSDPVYGHVYNPARTLYPGRFTNLLDVAEACPTLLDFNGVPYVQTQSNSGSKVLACFDLAFGHKNMKNTYMSGLAQYFAQYSGTLNLHFMYTGPTNNKAKYMVAYIPPGTHPLPETPEMASHCYHAEWDTGLNSTFTFTVPYFSAADYAYTYADEPEQASVQGWVGVYQITDTHEKDGAVIVTVSAGPDFEFRMPISPSRQ
uniref:POLYPROTEIN n=1 Tax=Foot-and-mouth disease virus SAT 1 TaxID=12122 RepID=UPI0001EB6970|nr:Chain 3, Polyprotein [Foot-and-mouth disease virus SAT 1]